MRMLGVLELFIDDRRRFLEARLAYIDCLRFFLLSKGFFFMSLGKNDGNF